MPDDAEEPPQTTVEQTLQERREARAELPAVYIDTWSFLTWRGHVRLAVGESLYKADHYRAAFVMDLAEAESFAEHLLDVVHKRQERDAAITKKDASQDSE